MNSLKYITPQFFHYWLNDCPVKWERIDDDITTVSYKFFLPLEGESNNNKEEIVTWSIQTITPIIEVARL